MDWSAVSAIAEVIGTVVVVISLGYVAAQIKQNTRATRYQTTQNLIAANSDANYLISTHTDIAEIMQKGCYDPDQLTDVERLRFNTFYFAYYNHFDFAYHQYLTGQLDEVMWEKMAYEMPLYVSNLPGVAKWWGTDKSRLSEQFVAYMEDRMADMDKSLPTPTISPSNESIATEQVRGVSA